MNFSPQRHQGTRSDLQEKIDQIQWYHEFDFGDGLRARSLAPDIAGHRKVWRFIDQQLEAVAFRGKTVLDIGCWDGYWSFFAERKGASHVLAADDITQNWSDGRGILLARDLLKSKVEIRQDLSIYQLTSLNRRFDVILCLGVFYHLLDPFFALAQIRHCCHRNSIVLLEGNLGRSGMRADEVRSAFQNCGAGESIFVPSALVFKKYLEAAYLRVQSQTWMNPRPGILRALARNLKHYRKVDTAFIDRAYTLCAPFEGVNGLHVLEPPFELKKYDDRFRSLTD
ncbi:MAG TPA: DUF1698 domain-containing protein [Acidobacteriota bacterium]|jgi:tRNA (mo5U34)-methyltransferase